LIKVWFSASTFVLKIATFAKPETVMRQLGGRPKKRDMLKTKEVSKRKIKL
jgi:hypothetical protein